MAGAATLAAADDHRTAFRRYESAHRAWTDPKQRNLRRAVALLVPKTRRGILIRNLAAAAWGLLTPASPTGRMRLRRQPTARGELRE